MTNHATLLRSLVIYGICLPLAVVLGFLATNSANLDVNSIGAIGVIIGILLIPILLRFHYFLLVASWNMSMILFFLPGRPAFTLAMSAISFLIFIGHRTLDKRFRFLSVPEINRPVIALVLVILITAEATGGMGLRAFGGDVYGGKRYIVMFIGIMGYFALTARRIPLNQAHLYLALFFLPGITAFAQDFYAMSGPFKYLYLLFPPTLVGAVDFGVTRFVGMSTGASLIFCYMLARYGIKGIFSTAKPWRGVFFVLISVIGLFGGFRSALIAFIFSFTFHFFLEGAHRTRLFPTFLFIFVSIAAICLPLMQRLPSTIQRSFAFIPFLPIDPIIKMDAEGSSDWRIRMWKAAWPDVPRYLLIGKGLGMSVQDFNFAVDSNLSKSPTGDDYWGALAAGDYHNGPLSVIITFGIWGALAFLWLLRGGIRVLYYNYKYGDESLKMINTFLLSYFMARVIVFMFVVGGFQNDLTAFLGLLGLSVSLNGGMARQPQTVPVVSSKADRLAALLPQPKSAFSR